jgi:N-acetylmuramoyl-L-alanine amidase
MKFQSLLPAVTCLFLSGFAIAQKPVIKLVTPAQRQNPVSNARQFITGTTCKECTVTVNGAPIKVYKTGVFAYAVTLKQGENSFKLSSSNNDQTAELDITYQYTPPKAPTATDSFTIESIQVLPEGDLALLPGETMRVRVKAKPGCRLVMNEKYILPELPASQNKGMAGIYQFNYRFKTEDSLLLQKLRFNLTRGAQSVRAESKNRYTVLDPDKMIIGRTTGSYVPMYSGLGEDRLGGTRAGFLDQDVQVQITGRIGNLYKAKLNDHLSVFIPQNQVETMPEGTAIPRSLTGNIRATGDSLYDYVQVELSEKLPYLSVQELNPSRIRINIYGASINTNWLVQYPETLQEVRDVSFEQAEDDRVQVTLQLNHQQHWGHKIYYNGNVLIIKVRRQKDDLSLKNMIIGMDAGHGGSNTGARGISGAYEKEFTLDIAKRVRDLLVADSAKVIMTRESDISFENNDRLVMFHKREPDFALSIHLNSAGDPLRVKGTSTYYKHVGFKNLSKAIYMRMQETGLYPWGHIGNFNFFLNSTTEFPTALVETVFLSHPEDEEKMFDPAFRQLMAEKIVAGVRDWLKSCR